MSRDGSQSIRSTRHRDWWGRRRYSSYVSPSVRGGNKVWKRILHKRERQEGKVRT